MTSYMYNYTDSKPMSNYVNYQVSICKKLGIRFVCFALITDKNCVR